jgi:hypothetical protein
MNRLKCLLQLSFSKARTAIHKTWQAETKDDGILQLSNRTLTEYPYQESYQFRLFHSPSSHQAEKVLPVKGRHAALDVQTWPMRRAKQEKATRL